VAFIHIAFFVVNVIPSGKLCRVSRQKRLANRVLVGVKRSKQFGQRSLPAVSHDYALAGVDVSKGVCVYSLLV
jgi:hypothetical protein